MNLSARVTNHGFTLIELSIVLVIIGLLVSGVLIGQELVSAAGVRSTITQLEKYNTAANTFYTKFGYLPGDIPDPAASGFGLQARGQYAGEGDGDGAICGVSSNAPNSLSQGGTTGESAMFWRDLGTAGFIENSYNAATPSTATANFTGSIIGTYMPPARLGNGNYIYIWCNNAQQSGRYNPPGQNFFAISTVNKVGTGKTYSNTGISANQAFAIDTKIDDTLPQSGKVIALYIDSTFGSLNATWAEGGYPNIGGNGGYPVYAPGATATAPASDTCYDNGGNWGKTEKYSTEYSGGTSPNCALSFQMIGEAR